MSAARVTPVVVVSDGGEAATGWGIVALSADTIGSDAKYAGDCETDAVAPRVPDGADEVGVGRWRGTPNAGPGSDDRCAPGDAAAGRSLGLDGWILGAALELRPSDTGDGLLDGGAVRSVTDVSSALAGADDSGAASGLGVADSLGIVSAGGPITARSDHTYPKPMANDAPSAIADKQPINIVRTTSFIGVCGLSKRNPR